MIRFFFKEKGQAVVETALLFPVLLGATFMTVDIGRGYAIQNAMNAAARDEARLAASDPRFHPSFKPSNGQTVDTARSQAVQEIKDRLIERLNKPERPSKPMDISVLIPGWNGAPGTLEEDPIAIRISRDFPLMTLQLFGMKPTTLHAASSSFVEIGRSVSIDPQLFSLNDPDLDGDGTANSRDPDADGDGVPNENDYAPYDEEVQYAPCSEDRSSPLCTQSTICKYYQEGCTSTQRCRYFNECASDDERCIARNECATSEDRCRLRNRCTSDVQRCQIRNECTSDAVCALQKICENSDQKCRVLNQCTSSDQRCAQRSECTTSEQRCRVRDECVSDVQRCQVRGECSSDAKCELYNQCESSNQRCAIRNQCTSSDQRCLIRNECTSDSHRCRVRGEGCVLYEA